jgi:hypothetical protein
MCILALSATFTLAYSASGLNVVLSNQNPDPVSPGNIVELNVKVSNPSDRQTGLIVAEFIENEYFKIVEGQEKERNLGIMPPFSSFASSTSYGIAKFQVKVSDNAPIGTFPIRIKVSDPEDSSFYDFDVSVLEENPKVEIKSFQIETIEAGKSSILTMEVENLNTIELQNLIISLNLDEVEEKVLSTDSGSNQKIIRSLGPNEVAKVTFKLSVSPDALSKPYLLPATIQYEDTQENVYTETITGSVRVYSEPMVVVRLDSQEKFTKGRGKMTLSISNPGTSTVKGTQLEILPSDKYNILEGDFHYVGDLNPDDFQTVQLDSFVNSVEGGVLNVKLTYLDSYNNKNEEFIEVPLKVYNDAELEQFGIKKANDGSSNTGLIIYVVIAVIFFVVGMLFGKSRSRKKQNK